MFPDLSRLWLRSLPHMLILCTLIVCLFRPATTARAANGIIFVKANATGNNDGSSWINAYTKLQDGLNKAKQSVGEDEIWIAAGVYYPDEGGLTLDNNPNETFVLAPEMAIYGGFAGTETQRSQRNVQNNVTVLSGDLTKDDTTDANHVVTDAQNIVGTNARHVVVANNTDATTRLDGVVITGGVATASTSNCPDGCGGGIYANSGSLIMENLTISGNRAYYGAGIMVLGASTPTLKNSKVTGNRSGGHGGGLQAQDGANILIENVEFRANVADSWGGAAYFSANTVTLKNATVQENLAEVSGGGVYSANAVLNISETDFVGNSAKGFGGGVYAKEGTVRVEQSHFESNHADGSYGGGIMADTLTLIISECDFVSNVAFFGGGGIGVFDAASNITLTDVQLKSNRTVDFYSDGGGLAQFGGTLTMLRVLISRNSTNKQGGGAMISSTTATLVNVQFLGNQSRTDAMQEGLGSALSLRNSPSVAHNVVFSGNQGPNASVYVYSGSLTLNAATFALNSSPGVTSMYLQATTVRMSNSIVWDNPDSTKYFQSASVMTVHNTLESSPLSTSPNGNGNIQTNISPFRRNANPGANGWDADPSLTDADASDDDYGDLRLLPNAPAIDAGSNDRLPTDLLDLDGDSNIGEKLPLDIINAPRTTRISGATAVVDMGAYEHQNVAPVASITSPLTANEGSAVSLDASPSTDADGTIVSYGWDCTNNGSIDASSATPTGNSCTYLQDGSYTLRLVVTDNLGLTDTATTNVTVANVAPILTAAQNQSTFANNAKLFSLGSFTDPGSEGTWAITIDWGDNTTPTKSSVKSAGTLPTASHTYATAGVYNVVVTVADDDSSGESGFQVTVNAPPAGAPNVTAPADQTATVAQNKSFNLGSFTDPSSVGPWQVSVTWGDGSTNTQFSAPASGTLAAKAHTYAANGTYDVLVSVSDGALSGSASFQIVVTGGQTTEDKTGNVTGNVFADTNDNGSQDEGEAGIAGVTLTIVTAQQSDVANVALTRTAASDAEGNYRFDNLPIGGYRLTLTLPAGFVTSAPQAVDVQVQADAVTTAPTFRLQPMETPQDKSSIFLPTLRR